MDIKTKHTPETLEGAKEFIAKSNGFKSWTELQYTWLTRTNQVLVVHENYVDQMHELVSKSKADLLKENQELKESIEFWKKAYNGEEAQSAQLREGLVKSIKENQELKALLEPFRKLANSVLTEREVLPSENEGNRPLYSFNFSDITYNDLRRILDHFKSKAQ